jgi:squalene synthase HpnC
MGVRRQPPGRHAPRMRRAKKRDSMAFSDDLRRYGPDAKNRLSREASLTYCARLTAEHWSAFRSIYAFCRWSDDLGDEVGDRKRSRELLSWWRDELRAMYRGRVSHPVMIALAETVERYGIPIEPFERLISAFEQDQEVTEYETFEQLLHYCERSANPVGQVVLHVAGAFTPENVSLADSICTGLQLANFWQDVARDLAIGRIYLPREDRVWFGCSERELWAGVCTPAIRRLMEFEVGRARGYFREGRSLVNRLPRCLAVDLDLFVRGGVAILDAIEARGFDVLTARPILSRSTKLRLIARAAAAQGMNAFARMLSRASARLARSAGERDERDRDLQLRSKIVPHPGTEESR